MRKVVLIMILVALLPSCSRRPVEDEAEKIFASRMPGWTIERVAIEEHEVAASTYLVEAASDGGQRERYRMIWFSNSGEWEIDPVEIRTPANSSG